VDIYVDGNAVWKDVLFTNYSEYAKLPEGKYDIQVKVAGTDTVVLDVPGAEFEAGATPYYTVIAENAQGDLTKIVAEVKADRPLAPLRPGTCGSRVLHLAPDAPPVTVWVNGRVRIASLVYNELTSGLPEGAHAVVEEGEARVQLSIAGSDPPAIVFDAMIPCPAGEYHTVTAMGEALNPSIGIVGVVIKDNQPSKQLSAF
jgi:hypothetical protein